MATILITGATGTVGKHVVEALHAKGIKPRAAVRDKNKAAQLGQTAELVQFDFSDEDTYAKALKGVDKAFLLTPLQPDMVDLTEKFVKAAKEAGVRHIVKLSAIGAGAEHPIARWHREAETVIEDSGLAFTHLRANGFMQNLLGPLGDPPKRFGKLYQPLGDAKVSYVDARDIAAVAAVVLTTPGHEGKTYDITGPAALSSDDLAVTLSKVTGKEIAYEDPGEERAREGLINAPMPDWMADALLGLFAAYRAGTAENGSDTVRRLTGERPRSFLQFAAEHKDRWA